MNAPQLALESSSCDLCQLDDGEPIAVGEDFEYRTSPDSFLMMRCRGCGLLYLNPRPKVEALSQVYPDSYHAFDFSPSGFRLIHSVRRQLEASRLLRWCQGLSDDAKILDVGCGDGFHLELLREFGQATWTLKGVDVDRRAVVKARSKQLDVFHGSLEALPVREAYDLALMIMTLEHLNSPLATLREVRRHLKPGGKLVVVTDNVDSPDFALFGGRFWGGYHFPRHTYLFSTKTLTRMGEVAGWQPVRVKTGFSPVNWAYSIRNWFDDWGAPRWLVRCFSLQSPLALALFTVWDMPLSWIGKGAVLQAVFQKPEGQTP